MRGKKKLLFVIGIVLIFSILAGISLTQYRGSKWKKLQFDNSAYEGIFCAMDRIPSFSEEDFLAYRGLKIMKADFIMDSFHHIEQMLEKVCSNQSNVDTVYMELNPVTLWKEAGTQENRWREYLDKYILKKVREYEEITFEILLPYPKIIYWVEMSASDLEEYLNVYASFVKTFEAEKNILIHYIGAEQWLCSNAGNYEDTFQLNPKVERSVFLSTLCDRKYVMNSEIMSKKLEQLRELVADYADWKAGLPDFSEWNLVFLGDSIIGMDRSSASVSGVAGALSGAESYNCGKSGATAAIDTQSEFSFLQLTDILVTGNENAISDKELRNNFEAFFQKRNDKDHLCFLINFGLNDYFIGCPVDNPSKPYDTGTYAGALRTGIMQLQKKYPEAEIVVMVPTYINYFEEGNEVKSTEGDVLDAYRSVVRQVAEQMQVYCKDNYIDMFIAGDNCMEYLSDGCHLNEKGRFLLGEQIIHFLEENVIHKSIN